MARSRETKIELTAYDDLFQTDESREEAKLSKIRDIPISEIDEFPDHPFKVLMDEDMEQLVESIKRNGVMTPATVRLKEDGRYELISGHRRKKACELAGLETLKCEVKELTRDEAIIVMVESNLQRSVILPSEKAFAYKMRLEAMKRQAGRPPKENASPLATNLSKGRSDEELGELVGESKDQIRRYIRLTELVPEILQMVDERQIAFRPAVEVSYLTEEQQYTLLEAMEYNDATPSLAQAIKMKKYNQDGKLTSEVIQSIMEEEKPNQKEKPAFRDERITKLIPKTVPRGQETNFVVKALEFYNRHLKRLGAAIDYIEENLDKEISYDEAAHIACCSTYYFQRIFSYVSGVSLSEYIRRRKMTQAAFELQRTDNKVIDVAHKYGYSSPTSFNRAFQSVHGIAPIAAKSMGCTLCAYPSIQFSIIVLGGSAMAYHIEEKKSIRIIGIRIPLVEDAEENMRNVPAFWKKAVLDGSISKLAELSNKNPDGILGVSVYNNPEDIYYYIAVSSNIPVPEGMVEYMIPEGMWVVFENDGVFKEDVQSVFRRFLTEFLPFSGYEYAGLPDVEIYPVCKGQPSKGHSEVWIAIKKAKEI